MKKFIMVFVSIILVICCCVSSFIVICSPTLTLISKQRRNVLRGETATYEFSLPVEAKINIAFFGNDEKPGNTISGTWGEYQITILDSYGETAYEESDVSKRKDKLYTTVLPAGDYSLLIKNMGSKLSYVMNVTYESAGEIEVTSLKLNKSKLNMNKGSTYQLKAEYAPEYTSEDLKWKSSNSKIASVDGTGKVKANKMGKATITVYTKNLKKKCTVEVKKQYIEIWSGKNKSLLSVVDQIKGYENAKWSSSDKSIVTVTNKGKITTKGSGMAKVYCKIKDTKYTFVIYSYSKKELKENAIDSLKSMLKNPNSLIINEVSYPKAGVVEIDYSAMNGFGGYNRSIYTETYKKGVFYSYDVY